MKSKYVTVNINKPIWSGEGVFEVGIRDTNVWKAKREKKDLRIVIPQGETIISVKKFLSLAVERPFVGRFPDNPMRFFYAKLFFEKKNTIEDVSIPSDIKERLKEVALEQGWYQRKFI